LPAGEVQDRVEHHLFGRRVEAERCFDDEAKLAPTRLALRVHDLDVHVRSRGSNIASTCSTSCTNCIRASGESLLSDVISGTP
jgi:hypothetical protein